MMSFSTFLEVEMVFVTSREYVEGERDLLLLGGAYCSDALLVKYDHNDYTTK